MADYGDIGRRRIGRGWIVVGIMAALLLLAAVTPSPYAIERPGPVVNAFGDYPGPDGEDVPVIRIDGATSYPTSGALNILSVSVRGTPSDPVSWLSLGGVLLDPTRSAVPLGELFPDGMTAEERTAQSDEMMRVSQLSATAAALRLAGLPVTERLLVVSVFADGAAEGVLREGDLIVGAGGAEVHDFAGLQAAMLAAPAGEPLALEIERDGRRIDLSLVPEITADGSPRLGIGIGPDYEFPFDVDLELDSIGGPSAGLTFALAIYDLLTPGQLTGGEQVSVTGTIEADRAVGPIGGLTQKIWGASLAGSELLLMPVENCAEVPDRLPEGMRIMPVATLDEAVGALDALREGGDVPGMERCTAPGVRAAG